MAGLMETILTVLLALVSLGCLVGGVVLTNDENRIGRRLRSIRPVAAEGGPRGGWRKRMALVNNFIVPGTDADEVQRGLRAAGYYSADAMAVFGALRLAAGILAAVLAAVALVVMHKWAGLFRYAPLLAAGAALLAAKPVLAGRAASRSRRINAEMPFTLDVLLMMLESGVSLDQCFRTFAASEGGAAPLVRKTVAALVDDLQRGMAYDMALARWADRLGVMGARELAGVFRQALTHGSELATTVRQFAIQFAETRVAAARESIGQKTVQMTVAMMMFLMPALMIVLAGPAVHTLLTTLSSFK